MGKSLFSATFYGLITIVILVLFSSVILALTIRFTNISPQTLAYLSIAFGLLTLFVGGFVAGMKGKANGWMIGVCTGVSFFLLTFIVQYLGYDEVMSIKQILYFIAYIFAAICGSIIGVNLFQAKTS